MKTLTEHNKSRAEHYYKDLNAPVKNGIACPECGEAMLDSRPGVLLTSYPPQKNVHCPKCGYTGYRVA